MPQTLTCDTHRPHPALIRDLRSTHVGDFIYRKFPIAIVQTENWTRLVIAQLYREGRYPIDYYTKSTKVFYEV